MCRVSSKRYPGSGGVSSSALAAAGRRLPRSGWGIESSGVGVLDTETVLGDDMAERIVPSRARLAICRSVALWTLREAAPGRTNSLQRARTLDLPLALVVTRGNPRPASQLRRSTAKVASSLVRAGDQLCSLAGLTPTEQSSDEHTRRGDISKQGSRSATRAISVPRRRATRSCRRRGLRSQMALAAASTITQRSPRVGS